jgi:hypothetical protein
LFYSDHVLRGGFFVEDGGKILFESFGPEQQGQHHGNRQAGYAGIQYEDKEFADVHLST